MAIERWTDDRLDKLADGVERLVVQLQQLGHRVEQTCNRVEALVEANCRNSDQNSDPASGHSRSDQSLLGQGKPLGRLTVLESQMQHLTQRVQYLEQQKVALISTSRQLDLTVMVEDEDIEDEPDEILWDFLDPAERQKRE